MPRSYCLLMLATLLTALAGCDLSGEYEKRAKEALERAANQAAFDQMVHRDAVEVTDVERKPVGVKLRLPATFDAQSVSLATEPRAQPPFVQLPGFSYSLERMLDDNAGVFAPAYVYFAAAPKADHKLDALQASLAQQVGSALPGASWADATLQTPSGQTKTFKRLRGEGAQVFDNTAQMKEPVTLDGRFDLYIVEAPGHFVLIGFRAPKIQATKYQLDASSEAAMGTVEVSGAAAPAAEGGGEGAEGSKG